jgi:YHS domain-containing protein
MQFTTLSVTTFALLFAAFTAVTTTGCGSKPADTATTPTSQPAAAQPAAQADEHPEDEAAHHEAMEKAAAAHPGPLVPFGAAKPGDKTTCPVSGETFVVAADSPKADYDGKTYYFCCGGCAGDFKADPASFLKKK